MRNKNFDVLTIKEAGLTGSEDEIIFDFAFKNKRALLTFDRGFGDIFRFNISKSSGVIIILVNQIFREEIADILLNFISFIKSSDLKGKLVIIGKTKIRISGR